MSYSINQMIRCFFVLIITRTDPWYDWFKIFKTILLSLLKNPSSIFSRISNKTKSDFLTNYLSKNIIVTSPFGLKFLARPHYEDLVRFLFSHIVAKWEPINEIKINLDDAIIDIGANVGYYSLKFSKMMGVTGQILAIEPDPDTCSILEQNCTLNNFKNIEVLNLAISDKNDIINLFQDKSHSGKSSVFSNSDDGKAVKITTQTLDSLTEKRFSTIDFIKIDTEGAELSILKGAAKTLKITNKILIELHEEILEKNQQDPLEIKTILESNGFKIKTFPEYWNAKTSQNKIFHSDYILGEK